MLDWINLILDNLNKCAGLFALLTLIATIVFYLLNKKSEKRAAKEREEKEKQAKDDMAKREREDAQAELDAMGVTAAPISLYGYNKMQIARARYLWKKAGRGRL